MHLIGIWLKKSKDIDNIIKSKTMAKALRNFLNFLED